MMGPDALRSYFDPTAPVQRRDRAHAAVLARHDDLRRYQRDPPQHDRPAGSRPAPDPLSPDRSDRALLTVVSLSGSATLRTPTEGERVTAGIVSWGVYLPYWRLQAHRDRRDARRSRPGGGPARVASYDEDTTTMGVEAARRALAALDGDRPEDLCFSTPVARLPRQDQRHRHPRRARSATSGPGAYDLVGSVRSGVAALRAAAAALASRPTHDGRAVRPADRAGRSADERDGGDGAVAIVFGDSAIDRWPPRRSSTGSAHRRSSSTAGAPRASSDRGSGRSASARRCTCRWSRPPSTDALKRRRPVRRRRRPRGRRRPARPCAWRPPPRRARGPSTEALVDDRPRPRGNLGAAQPGSSSPTCSTGPAGRAHRRGGAGRRRRRHRSCGRPTPSTQVRAAGREAGLARSSELATAGRDDLPYARFLTWRGELRREPPRRPDPERPGAPATWRSTGWKGGFDASRCEVCGFRHLPPTRVCLKCQAIDQMERRAAGRRPGPGRHVHHRPPGLLACRRRSSAPSSTSRAAAATGAR